MTSKEDKTEHEQSKLVNELSAKVLKDLKEGIADTDVEGLMKAVEAYTSLPNHKVESIKKWQEDISLITQLLEAQYVKIQEELRGMVENNPKLAAYNKADAIEEEE